LPPRWSGEACPSRNSRRGCSRTSNPAQLAGIRSWFFGDWIPSKANPADVPTRPERFHEMPRTAVWVDMVIPPIEQVESDLAAWIAGVRARAT